MNPIVKDPLQKRIELTNWIILAIIFSIALIFSLFKFVSFEFALGILLGGFISIVNFFWMERGLRKFFGRNTDYIKGHQIVGKYIFRIIVTGIVLYFLIAYKTVNVIGLIIGLSVVVINIITTAIISLTKNNFVKEVK
ncbi:MAG: ATP synthase subunit I [Syntrophaceae bacterium]|nr:ATP synthase subunit I [Syntrophaceae bacterium]